MTMLGAVRRSILGARALVLGAVVVVGAGCAVDPAGAERSASTHQSIINGTVSPATQDIVVFLRSNDGSCSASLIAKNLILTARHCVGTMNADQTQITNSPANQLRVFTGQTAGQKADANAAPAAIGKQLITAPGTNLTPDIALLVLDRAVAGPIAHIRLDGGVQIGEPLTIVGYGLTQANTIPGQRMQRTGKSVIAIAPAVVQGFTLNPGEFTFSEAACSGDSGGPALHGTNNAVLGVASRVGNGLQPSETAPANFCIGSNTVNYYTSLAAVRSLVMSAFTAAGATPLLEGQPDPLEEQDAAPDAGPTDTAPSSTDTEGDVTDDTESTDEETEAEPTPKKKKKRAPVVLASSGCSLQSSGSSGLDPLAPLALALALTACLRRRALAAR